MGQRVVFAFSGVWHYPCSVGARRNMPAALGESCVLRKKPFIITVHQCAIAFPAQKEADVSQD